MNPFLNLDPLTYEAIILAFVVIGLIQSVALRRKWMQAEKLKSDAAKIAKAGVKALFAVIGEASKVVLKLTLENNRLKREVAEWQREAMEAAADRDDALDGQSGPRPSDPSEIFDRIFGSGGPIPGEHVATFSLGPDGVLKPLDGKSAAFAARTGLNADDILHGGTFTRDTGEKPVLNVGDLLDSLRSIQRRRGPGNDPLHDLLFGGTPFAPGRFARGGFVDPGEPPHPTFGDTDEAPEVAAARDFGPDSGAAAEPTTHEAEACGTQRPAEPRSYPSSSPRAG